MRFRKNQDGIKYAITCSAGGVSGQVGMQKYQNCNIIGNLPFISLKLFVQPGTKHPIYITNAMECYDLPINFDHEERKEYAFF